MGVHRQALLEKQLRQPVEMMRMTETKAMSVGVLLAVVLLLLLLAQPRLGRNNEARLWLRVSKPRLTSERLLCARSGRSRRRETRRTLGKRKDQNLKMAGKKVEK